VAGSAADAYPGLSPRQLMVPTLADLWNLPHERPRDHRGQGSAPRAAIPLAGHGACLVNGRPVIAVSYATESGRWATSSRVLPAARLPEGHGRARGSSRARRHLDGPRGRHARGDPRLPRSSRGFETDALKRLIEREPFGADDVSDLVMVNLKTPDYVGHRFGPDSPELAATLAALDRDIRERTSPPSRRRSAATATCSR
jgi:hypothetical protein